MENNIIIKIYKKWTKGTGGGKYRQLTQKWLDYNNSVLCISRALKLHITYQHTFDPLFSYKLNIFYEQKYINMYRYNI